MTLFHFANVFPTRLQYRLLLAGLGMLLAFPTVAQRGLELYLDNARQSSPLILDNHIQIQANALEAQRLQALYNKPLIQLTGTAQFAPIF